MARQQRQQDKMARRLATKETTGTQPLAKDVDPDIAGIVPGPQPRGEEWFDDQADQTNKQEQH